MAGIDPAGFGALNLAWAKCRSTRHVKRFLDLLAAGNPPDARSVTRRGAAAGTGRADEIGRAGSCRGPHRGSDASRTRRSACRCGSILPSPAPKYSRGSSTFTAAAWSPAASPHTMPSRVLSQIPARSGLCRSITGWPPNIAFRPRSRTPSAAVQYVGTHAAEFGIDVARLGICGDSAGGTLAAATCQALARTAGPRLKLQVLICPILDYSRSTPSKRDLGLSGYLVDQATLDHDLMHYLPEGTDPGDPRYRRCAPMR